MSKSRQPKTVAVRTTTVRIVPPSNFKRLSDQYCLVRYVLSTTFQYEKTKYSSQKFARLHNALKEQIEAPYRVFTHAIVEGKKRWAVYVLYPRDKMKGTEPPNVTFEDDDLPSKKIEFQDEQLISKEHYHNFIKLLQIAYFRSEPQSSRFVGMDKCYVYAKREEDKKGRELKHVCLDMNLMGDKHDHYTFAVYGQARPFRRETKPDPKYFHLNVYYTLLPTTDGFTVFGQVKRNQVEAEIKNGSALYIQRGFGGQRTTLDYHSIQDGDVEQTRGYLVDTFIRGLAAFLEKYGFALEPIEREFYELPENSTSQFKLPTDTLESIYVYDMRYKRDIDLNQYLAPFRSEFSTLVFEIVDDLPDDCAVPVLIFQDCSVKAFNEGNAFHKEIDPHQQIYAQKQSVAKQFINVNDNDPDHPAFKTVENYLKYGFEAPSRPEILMILNQLFLKHLILHHPTASLLPLNLKNLMFVHSENRWRDGIKIPYQVATYIEGGRICFLNLQNKPEKDMFYQRLDSYGPAVAAAYDDHTGANNEDDSEDAPSQGTKYYDVILGKNLCVEILDARETLLYNYEEIIRRLDEARTQQDIDDLKLTPHYQTLVGDSKYDEEYFVLRGFKGGMKVKKKQDEDAWHLYEAVRKYDAYLDSLRDRYDNLSFLDLKNTDEFRQKIAEIFEHTWELHTLYKRIGLFKGTREADLVSVYEGIWYTDDLRYVVGASQGMNVSQDRAHRVRQFIIYEGADTFDIKLILEAMSVQFVRLNQYTVRPYPFHLIDLYIDNVLQYTKKMA